MNRFLCVLIHPWIFFIGAVLVANVAWAQVGFFSPGGIPPVLIKHTQIGSFNAHSAGQVAENLERMRGTSFKTYIDLGPMITGPAAPRSLKMRYTTGDARVHVKEFAPGVDNKLRVFLPDEELKRVLEPVLKVMARYSANIEAVELADEPYINGISKLELERVGRLIRSDLDVNGLRSVKLAVVFAGGMFNRDFAGLMDKHAGVYAEGLDNHFRNGAGSDLKAYKAWVEQVKNNRLVTYDRAGNMYVGGGLPKGFDIYGFDFYLSTLLLDGLHEDTLSWFAAHGLGKECTQFSGKPMSRLRQELSFFHDGPVLQGGHYRVDDKQLLDAMYQCRMSAVTEMLVHEARGRRAHLLMLTESSNNGLLEFDSGARAEQAQPNLLVESRVLDEVERGETFYAKHLCTYSAGLMFFTFDNAYDASIKLNIGGASDMPSVMASIDRFAHKFAPGGAGWVRERDCRRAGSRERPKVASRAYH